MALALHESTLVERVLVTQPNAGMASFCGTCDVDQNDIPGLVEFTRFAGIDLVVVGPEGPLVNGLVDALTDAGIPTLGPHAAAARIEGSKRFAKEVMRDAGIPTEVDMGSGPEPRPAAESVVKAGRIVRQTCAYALPRAITK